MPLKKPISQRGKRSAPKSSTAIFEKLLKTADAIQHYQLRLYITGTTARSSQAIANIRALCEEFLSGRYDLEVVDIYQQPNQAAKEQIIAAPTLIKELPIPPKRLIGDLSDRNKVLLGLDLKIKSSLKENPPRKTRWTQL